MASTDIACKLAIQTRERQAGPFRELVARFLCDVSSLLAACMHNI